MRRQPSMYTVEFLRSRRVWFEELLHQPASSSTKHAHHMHVPGRMVAKTVLVQGRRAVRAGRVAVDQPDGPGSVRAMLGVPAAEIRLATTDELLGIFTDCEPGVVPPFGKLYDLDTVFDVSLAGRGRAGLRRQHAPRRAADAGERLCRDRGAVDRFVRRADCRGRIDAGNFVDGRSPRGVSSLVASDKWPVKTSPSLPATRHLSLAN